MAQQNIKEPENWRIFTIKNVIAVAAHVIIGTAFLVRITAQVDRLTEIVLEEKMNRKEQDGRNTLEFASQRNDISSLQLRMAVTEEQIKLYGKTAK